MTPVGVFFICQNEDKCHFVNSTNITRIRNKLDYIGLHDFIKTKHRQGYTL